MDRGNMRWIIVVGVWMVIIGCCALAESAFAWTPETRDVCFSWKPNTEPALAGYTIHRGSITGDYTFHDDAQLPALDEQGRVRFCNTYQNVDMYFAATAYEAGGLESDFSREVFLEQMDVKLSTPEDFQKESVVVNVTVNFN